MKNGHFGCSKYCWTISFGRITLKRWTAWKWTLPFCVSYSFYAYLTLTNVWKILVGILKSSFKYCHHNFAWFVGLPCAVISTKWLICLFAEVLPTETVLRIWDCVFNEGYKVKTKRVHFDKNGGFSKPIWFFVRFCFVSVLLCWWVTGTQLWHLTILCRWPICCATWLKDLPSPIVMRLCRAYSSYRAHLNVPISSKYEWELLKRSMIDRCAGTWQYMYYYF